MKPQPLKNKEVHVREFGWAGSLEKTKKKYPYIMFLPEDIKSAVEWLKQWGNCTFCESLNGDGKPKEICYKEKHLIVIPIDVINEAFEDVIK